MKTLIETIRSDLRMSQVEFAAGVGRSQATVSRWEQDASFVTLKDLAAIGRLCAERGVRFPAKALREAVGA